MIDFVCHVEQYDLLFQFTITFLSDTKMLEVEKSEMIQWQESKIVREVQGDTMIEVS